MGEKKEIKFVQGDGKDLNISPVEDHINDMVKKKRDKKENIVIPKTKSEKK